MLRAHYDRVEREETLTRFGVKSYRPDFGIPDLRTLVEVKFVGESTKVGTLQEEIMADVPGYLGQATIYDCLVPIVYDAAHKLKDARGFIEALKTIDGIVDVLVVPGF